MNIYKFTHIETGRVYIGLSDITKQKLREKSLQYWARKKLISGDK